MKTVWTEDEYGNLHFKDGGWSLTRWAGRLDKIDALNDDDDLDLDIYEDRIVAKGEGNHGYDTMAEPVSIPFTVLRAILEVVTP